MKIGVVAPGRPVDPTVATRVQAFMAITYPQVQIVFHPQCFASWSHFAGPDDVRASAFLEFANDPGFDAIWFARGGYGSNRILTRVMPMLGPPAWHKTYLGFSDMGFLLGALYARRVGRQAHAAMPVTLGRNDPGDSMAWALSWLIDHDKRGLEPSLADGKPAAAFNLAILTSMIGTPWLPDLTDHVLMVEEVSEPLYRIDRMLFQMAHATQLKGIAGVRLGAVTDVQENDPPFLESPEDMIQRWCKEMGTHYLGRAEIGHIEMNRVVPFGVA